MGFPYCERFGFDEANIKQRLAMMDLRDSDRSLAGRLQQAVITPNFTAIINEFFNTMCDWPEAQKILTDAETTKRVKQTITTFLLSLGSGFNSASYFEHRLHVGLAHEAVGLSLSLYLCAYRALTQAIINNFPESVCADQQLQSQLVEFLYKISTLDMSLAIETYHNSQVQNLEQREAQLKVKASTDSLTGMINRDHIFNELELVLKRGKQQNIPVCVVMADIDFFKRVNDTYGHQAGDAVLINVAQRIKSSLRDFDMVGRYGGEEFMLILQNTDMTVATKVAERIRLRIADHPINLPNVILESTISMGVAEMLPDDNVETLIERADQALYQSKHNGRNRVTVAQA
jgi:two-component system cell cycle response regulator